MNTRRLATTGAALVALGLGATGCNQTGTGTPSASGSASAGTSTSASPAGLAPGEALNELTAAAFKLNEQSVRVAIESGALKGGGLMDPPAKTADLTLSLGTAGQLRLLMDHSDGYLKVTGQPNAPQKWLHLDSATLGQGQLNLMPDGDPGGANRMLKNVADVQRTGGNTYAGTIDLTKAGDKNTAALGEKAKAIPFTATKDDQGRLTELTIDMSGIQVALGKVKTTYSDFGTAVSVQKPTAAETQEASPELLKAFGVTA
jgi:hypothetical protein